MLKKFNSLIISVFIVSKLFSQSICPDSIVFHTSDMGNGIEQFNIPLKFKIYRDSILIRNDGPDGKPSLMEVSFKILNKACQWNGDSSEGMLLYKIMSNNANNSRKGVINIRVKDKKGKIQLLYENSEPRIFNMK